MSTIDTEKQSRRMLLFRETRPSSTQYVLLSPQSQVLVFELQSAQPLVTAVNLLIKTNGQPVCISMVDEKVAARELGLFLDKSSLIRTKIRLRFLVYFGIAEYLQLSLFGLGQRNRKGGNYSRQ
jgi:hypothetical protein